MQKRAKVAVFGRRTNGRGFRTPEELEETVPRRLRRSEEEAEKEAESIRRRERSATRNNGLVPGDLRAFSS
ncbi:hypothetical protein L596_024341 [Steinernema carpocapsae]|uniref:Uncharacterized protein n=1 Tax=Steinernema carpocapsae TaxID=34508 RepID=A0A4U5MGG7_STECR|nr:hypothetical protein L596_024341 [Steinernema carpocapsae]